MENQRCEAVTEALRRSEKIRRETPTIWGFSKLHKETDIPAFIFMVFILCASFPKIYGLYRIGVSIAQGIPFVKHFCRKQSKKDCRRGVCICGSQIR